MRNSTTNRSSNWVRKLAYAGVFLALALVLPFLTGQIPQIGSMLCPMHLPVLLCGFVCGWPWGLAVGFIAPLLRSVIFGAPPIMTAAAMAFELAVYGLVTGLLYRVLPRKKGSLYLALVPAMVAGRLVWGLAQMLLMGLQGSEFTLQMFWAGAVTKAVPGIVLQLILVPLVVAALERAGLMENTARGGGSGR